MCATGHAIPVRGNIPRFVEIPVDLLSRRTQESFAYEWRHFSDWKPSGLTNFNDYFQGVDLSTLSGCRVLDAGCGMGRHARQIAPYVLHVVAVDLSRAVDEAARNTGECPNVDCIQGDVMALPLAEGVFDFVYCLGVVHHPGNPRQAVKNLAGALKPGGRLRLYVYRKKHGWQGVLLRVVALVRSWTTRLPFPVLRGLSWLLSLGLFGVVVLPYRLLSVMGVRRHQYWPLFAYTKYPFNILYNDQFDRFSAPLETRYERSDVCELLLQAGLQNVHVHPCFGWIADGTKPS